VIAKKTGKETVSANDLYLKEITRVAAMQGAMLSSKDMPNGSKLYFVEQGWENVIIKSSGEIDQVCDLREFEAALLNDKPCPIYIPSSALVTVEALETICRRHGVVKTIFKEAKGDNG
jgi:hypothetical protein